LQQLGSQYRGWIVIPTDDEQVRQLAVHHAEVLEVFSYAGPPWSTYQTVYNKRHAYEWCLREDIPTAGTFLPMSPDDDPGTCLTYPLIVKPAFKRNFRRHTTVKAIRVDSRAELARVVEPLLHVMPIEELLYQELVPGGGSQQWSYAGLFVDGEPLAAFTARRQRQHPLDFGKSSTYVVAEHDGEIEALSRRVIKALNYTGLAEAEWKRDPRDGRPLFLEVNARSWGWHSLGNKVLGNVGRMLYDHLVHGVQAYAEPTYGYRWVKYVTDTPVAFQLMLRGELTLREYLAGLRGQLVCCEAEPGDLRPLFLQLLLVPYLAVKRGL
jgi:predicted ATP-grasp superfamily ATP-dependent carboligase